MKMGDHGPGNLIEMTPRRFERFGVLIQRARPAGIDGQQPVISKYPRGKPRGIKSAASKEAAQALALVRDDAEYTS